MKQLNQNIEWYLNNVDSAKIQGKWFSDVWDHSF